jgi:tetratricopeptide (TPR) repeat protein
MRMRRISHTSIHTPTFFILTIAFAFVAALAARSFADEALFAHERAMLFAFPSAERAYVYGNRHFDARASWLYNIMYAEAMYNRALSLDPTLLGANHQLGRIAFLRGDFDTAMQYLNTETELPNGPVTPSTYYMKGLVLGYMGDYENAAAQYAAYLESDPTNWAALNDYAWVLLKDGRIDDALIAVQRGLKFFPDNPWLLNSGAIALYELERYDEALAYVQKALPGAHSVTELQWHTSYPGNDPRVAHAGIQTLVQSVEQNMHRIESKMNTHELQ